MRDPVFLYRAVRVQATMLEASVQANARELTTLTWSLSDHYRCPPGRSRVCVPVYLDPLCHGNMADFLGSVASDKALDVARARATTEKLEAWLVFVTPACKWPECVLEAVDPRVRQYPKFPAELRSSEHYDVHGHWVANEYSPRFMTSEEGLARWAYCGIAFRDPFFDEQVLAMVILEFRPAFKDLSARLARALHGVLLAAETGDLVSAVTAAKVIQAVHEEEAIATFDGFLHVVAHVQGGLPLVRKMLGVDYTGSFQVATELWSAMVNTDAFELASLMD